MIECKKCKLCNCILSIEEMRGDSGYCKKCKEFIEIHGGCGI